MQDEAAIDLTVFRDRHRLEAPMATHWACRIGPFTARFPKFDWRQDAIDAHDRHHLVTGYPLTIGGEIQMAAWEWGAGRYPDWRATVFCAPLIVLGALLIPRKIWRAYRRGCTTTSLYIGRRAARR